MVMTLIRWTLVMVGTAAYLGLAILGWGGWTAFFSHPARIALAVALALLAGASLFAGGNLSPGLRRSVATAGHCRLASLGCSTPICQPTRTGRNAGRSTAIPFAGWASCSSRPVVPCGSGPFLYSSVGSAGSSLSSPGTRWLQWRLWGDSPPELSRIAHQCPGVGPCLSCGGGRAAHGAHDPAAPRAHPCGRAAAAHGVWRRVRPLLRSRTSRPIPGLY